MLNRHVGCHFPPIISGAGYVRLVTDRLLGDSVNAHVRITSPVLGANVRFSVHQHLLTAQLTAVNMMNIFYTGWASYSKYSPLAPSLKNQVKQENMNRNT